MKRDVRNGEIEFWRGIFCLIVFVFHLSLDSASNRTLFPKGQIGVEFFFILSGLFMAKTADARCKTDTDELGWVGVTTGGCSARHCHYELRLLCL